ncbi:hypothetical protein [Pseudomonas benzenivorans]|uniref:hypothetical protein n=1 Tax=Pseudomonas benzenivorans TaxID=556533 RepID=UPI0035167DE9
MDRRADAISDADLSTAELACAVFAMAGDSLFAIDRYAMVCALDRAAISSFGYARAERVGRTVGSLMAERLVDGHAVTWPPGAGVGGRKDASSVPLHQSMGVFELNGRRMFVAIFQTSVRTAT